MKRLVDGVLPILLVGGLLLISLVLLSDATQNSARFGQLYSLLLVVTVLGLVALLSLIAWNLANLLRQVRERKPGARLTVRMVAMFSLLAVTPVLVVYYFSVTFLRAGIDSWFDVRIEAALDDALELGRTSLGVRMREMLKQTELVASDLASISDEQAAVMLDDVRRRSGATEMMLMGSRGHIVASSNIDPTAIVPNRPSDTTLLQVRQSGPYIGLEPIDNLGLHVRVAIALPEVVVAREPRILHALYPITERLNSLAESVQEAYARYRELAYLRKPLKTSFTLTLSLVLLLSLLTAVWAAFLSARKLVAPLRDLAEGTQAVADGDYETQLPPTSNDEVGFLMESFNDMTRKLARARDETRQSQQQVEAQRAYLEAVLRRLSTGVLTLDNQHRLVTANHAASQILGVELDALAGAPLTTLGAQHEQLAPLDEALRQHDLDGDWREQIIVFGASGRQVLMVSGARMPATDGTDAGHVMVFDDLTTLIQAQKNAAWSEVARRLAHEIKNPLTPIQLSAERLRHKYMSRLDDDDSQVFDRLTRTIVQQVESMKSMVNAFSDYARSPRMELEALDVNELVRDVVELYRDSDGTTRVCAELDGPVPPLRADAGRLRQVLHNLVRNALDASEGDDGTVVVSTRSVQDAARNYVDVCVHDHGPGFPTDILDRVFEPYVTTKPKGTGLGLAIVKKIVEEHGGLVWADNNGGTGASVTMRFPASTSIDASDSTEQMTTEAV